MVFKRSTQVGRTSGLVLTPKWGFPVAYKSTAPPTISTLPYMRAAWWSFALQDWRMAEMLETWKATEQTSVDASSEDGNYRCQNQKSLLPHILPIASVKLLGRFSLSLCLNIFKDCYQGQHWGNTKAEPGFSTFHPPGPSLCTLFGRKALHSISSNIATGAFLTMINLLMIHISEQHVSTAADLWNARDYSLTSDKLFWAGGFVCNFFQLLRPFSSVHHSQTLKRQQGFL